jgi:hypothetical protein
MLSPLLSHGNSITDNLIAILKGFFESWTRHLTLPQAVCHIFETVALAVKTEDDLLAPRCPVFNAKVQFH